VKKLGKQMTFGVVSVAMEVTITIWAQPSKPKRINQAIELLAECQPIYYTGSQSGTAGTYKQGMKDAQTYADYISYAVLPLHLSLPFQQLLKFIQRQMVKESITAIDEACDPTPRDGAHDQRILFEIDGSGRVQLSGGGTANTPFNRSGVMFSVPPAFSLRRKARYHIVVRAFLASWRRLLADLWSRWRLHPLPQVLPI
jgi:hypothetical protein